MKKSTPIQWGIRVLCYVAGLFFMAAGVAVSANSDLGISPVNSLPYVISTVTPETLRLGPLQLSLDPGTCVTLVFCSYILLQILILRRDFKPVNLFQILFSTIFGWFVNFTKRAVGTWALPGYPGRLVMLAISIALIAMGVFLYIEVDLVPMPMEGLSLSISEKLGIPFHNMKIVIDCVVVLAGAALSFLCLGRLVYIREGTILAALLTGKVISVFKKPLSPVIQKLCFREPG